MGNALILSFYPNFYLNIFMEFLSQYLKTRKVIYIYYTAIDNLFLYDPVFPFPLHNLGLSFVVLKLIPCVD